MLVMPGWRPVQREGNQMMKHESMIAAPAIKFGWWERIAIAAGMAIGAWAAAPYAFGVAWLAGWIG